jgi:hypothetical protein
MTEEEKDKKKKVKIAIDPKLWERFSIVAAADVGEHDEETVGIKKLDTLMEEYVSARMSLSAIAKKKLQKITKDQS